MSVLRQRSELAPVAATAPVRAGDRGLKRLQEVHQVLHLLLREANLEALVIKIHDLLEVACYSVMEVRRACSQASQNEALSTADVAALPADQRFAGIGGVVGVAGQRPLCAD